MARVVHFEVSSPHSAVSRKFYENVFGWKFTQWGGGEMEYWLISTGPEDVPGIDGGFGGAANDMQSTVVTVEVEDLDEALKQVAANGGQVVMPKDEIPGVGWISYVREPGGTVLGMIQNLPHPGA